ncbi:MAG: para-nitrobenzyl esterase [Porticoccaceae bacterium]|jgi:para-nitrobenzyl esterase
MLIKSYLRIGSRKDPNIVHMAHYFASRGWVLFSLDYRMKSDKGTVPLDWEQKTSNEDVLKIYSANREM